jgi:hypothetical protein
MVPAEGVRYDTYAPFVGTLSLRNLRSYSLQLDEALIEAFDTFEPPRPQHNDVPAKSVRHKIGFIRLPGKSGVFLSLALTTSAFAFSPPITVNQVRRWQTASHVYNFATATGQVAGTDEWRYVPERVTLAQIQALDELFALPGGPEVRALFDDPA